MTHAVSLKSLPSGAGVSLKPQHFETILDSSPALDFFEIHPENYMSPGGPHLGFLEKIRARYPLSMHSVGMSLGSAEGPKDAHLKKLKTLADRFQPAQISEHLSWSHWHDVFLNDLLPLPYTKEALQTLTTNINKVQDFLQRKILIENPSSYLNFDQQDYSEMEFINTLCKKTGCGLLLDLNNIVVSAFNNKFDSQDYLNEIDVDHIGEVHLAGHKNTQLQGDKLLKIDDHGSQVCEEAWDLLHLLLTRKQQALPLLVEWDTEVPDFAVLFAEAEKAKKLMQNTLVKLTLNRVCRC